MGSLAYRASVARSRALNRAALRKSRGIRGEVQGTRTPPISRGSMKLRIEAVMKKAPRKSIRAKLLRVGPSGSSGLWSGSVM